MNADLVERAEAAEPHIGLPARGLKGGHPYGAEIQQLIENPVPPPYLSALDDEPPPLEGGCIWVDTPEALNDLACLLAKEVEFGVDTEQHTRRSFLGFTALLQISTGTQQDYIIDAIALHDHMHVLRPVFADPSIIKVFHGADSDVLWLQRDFHIYVVNLFDTARACDVLGKPHRSLAYLLREYCSVISDKQFQRADWRIRPLTQAMLNYARTDAHYLTYIAGKLRLELLQRDHQIPKLNDGPHIPFLPVSSNQSGGEDNDEHMSIYEPDDGGEILKGSPPRVETPPGGRTDDREECRTELGTDNSTANQLPASGSEAAAKGEIQFIQTQKSIPSTAESTAEEDVMLRLTRAGHSRKNVDDEEDDGTPNSAKDRVNEDVEPRFRNSMFAPGAAGPVSRADDRSQASGTSLSISRQGVGGSDQNGQFGLASSTARPSGGQASSSDSGLGKSTHYVLAIRRSHQVSLHLYDKELSHPAPAAVAASLLSKFYSGYTPAEEQQLQQGDACFQAVVRMLCNWRDEMARVEDESLRYVLSDTALVAIAARCPETPDLLLSLVIASNRLPQSDGPGCPSSALATPSCLWAESDPAPSHILWRCAPHLCTLISSIRKEFGTANGADLLGTGGLKSGGAAGGDGGIDVAGEVGQVSLWGWLGIRTVANRIKERDRFVQEKLAGLGCERKMGSRRWKKRDQARARELFVQKFACKAPVYHNCRIYAGDGRLLCFCDKKKLDWYVQRGLAELTGEDPPAVRLLFEPKGRPEDENNEFYIQSKSNQCVVCGESTHYLRYRIIPSCYRQHFPERLKSHRSHDIVLLCVDCHELAHKAAEKYKRQVALEFGVPLVPARIQDAGTTTGTQSFVEGEIREGVPTTEGGVNPTVLRRAATALLRHGKNMPLERLNELQDVLREYYGREEIRMEDVENARLVGMGPRGQKRCHKHGNAGLRPTKGSVATERHSFCEEKETKTLEMKAHDVVFGYSTGRQQHGQQAEDIRNDADDEAGFVSAGQGGAYAPPAGATQQREHGSGDGRHPAAAGMARTTSRAPESEPDANRGDIEDAGGEEQACDGKSNGSGSHEVMEMQSSRGWHRKEAVLGHGHHGKKVVEMLIRQGGDDALRHFVRRWREVFVESLKPKFLPSAWDIKHSGRREFGEYSVYNPERKNINRTVVGSTVTATTSPETAQPQDGTSGTDDRGTTEARRKSNWNPVDVNGASGVAEQLQQCEPDEFAPHGDDVGTPHGDDVDTPHGDDVDTPPGDDVDTPHGDDVDNPHGDDVDTPHGDDVDTP
ncbi:hypothetical protein CBR_g39322 [Chara braunii]|uniref:HRDC domain-containing protein n=1 Tax=Chara braunii TaxID=69332 RepID=A0A388K163_CHABU|nr:hypothetical protein CBR_g39322 [Chara braunii]|eukprot:GBG63778.1 hypothetical protein CBR_g39322 [Chara braunii]